MTDVVVTVPRERWAAWLSEGSLVGELASSEYGFGIANCDPPPVEPGDRVYVVAWDRVRGYAPLVRLESASQGHVLVRAGGAVAVTIPEPARGFRGWRVRWWQRDQEVPFPAWRTEGVGGESVASASPPTRGKGARTERERSTSKHAYAPVIGLQLKRGGTLSPEEFEKQYRDALDEIRETGAISFTSVGERGEVRREVFYIRCGELLNRGIRCLRPRNHDDDCSPIWRDK